MPPDTATADNIDREVQSLREELLRPFADKFGFPLGNKSSATGLPTVLCLGNHSSGKSTFINHLAGANIQDTGVAPTDDSFTLLMYGAASKTEDGHAIVENPELPFGHLQQYGKSFLDHLKLKLRPEAALRGVCLIDSPGLIDTPGHGDDSSRGYNFEAVVRSLAETADLVVFFFDPDKPGTAGESLRIFTDSLSDVMYKLLIVFNKVDEFNDVRDFARTYGALCWNLSRVVRTKDIPHIYCTFVPGHTHGSQRTIELADFEKSTEALRLEIGRVGDRRRSNVVNSLLDTARQVRVHVAVSQKIGMELLCTRIAVWACVGVLLLLGGWLLLQYRSNNFLLGLGILSLIVGIGLAASARMILKAQLNKSLARLNAIFHSVFSHELLQHHDGRFLEGIWEAAKPRTIRFLETVGPTRVPWSPIWKHRLKKVRQSIERDIPLLLGSSKST